MLNVTINGGVINQFCLLLQTIQGRRLLVEGKVLNNLETTSLHSKCFCRILEGRKSKKDGSDVLAMGKVGREQNMEQGERREGSNSRHTL